MLKNIQQQNKNEEAASSVMSDDALNLESCITFSVNLPTYFIHRHNVLHL